MNYKQKRLIKFGIVVVLIIVSFSLYYFNDGFNFGLDLRGGSHVVLEARPGDDWEEEGRELDREVMQGVYNIMERRVDEFGLAEPVIQLQGEDRIIIELPDVDDPHEAVEQIGRTAELTWRNPEGEVVMRGDMVRDASPGEGPYMQPVVQFELTDEGAAEFERITQQYLGQNIAIYLDDEELTNPRINEPIRGGRGHITGYSSLEEAGEDATLIREGALPVPMEIIEQRNVGATLGSIAVQRSIFAGLIGLLLVACYMIFYYRFPGVLAAFVLIIYGIFLMGALAGLQATLTLPGIAGLILSIGMAVDANIIIFERIKDERKNGKTLRAAIDAGFSRAYMTIFDANVTTLITTLILAYFTTGAVRGFAITLGLGVILSMFTAFFVTRIVIELFSTTNLLKSKSAFGAARGGIR